VKLTPEQQKLFMSGDAASFSPEAGAWGRQGCTRVRLSSVDEEALGEAMTLAWQAVVSASARRTSKRAPKTRRSTPGRRSKR
jgi:hypothetical protein